MSDSRNVDSQKCNLNRSIHMRPHCDNSYSPFACCSFNFNCQAFQIIFTTKVCQAFQNFYTMFIDELAQCSPPSMDDSATRHRGRKFSRLLLVAMFSSIYFLVIEFYGIVSVLNVSFRKKIIDVSARKAKPSI